MRRRDVTVFVACGACALALGVVLLRAETASPLLSGDISYHPDPLEPPADGQILICCTQPRTDLVLDM
jgi:hypothetical protein